MASGKIISIASPPSFSSSRVLAQQLARLWAEAGKDTLLIQIESKKGAPDSLDWIHQFQSRSSVLLRNYLAGTRESYGGLTLDGYPEGVSFKTLLDLAASAYAWTLILPVAGLSEEARPLLDASDLLLWVDTSGPERLTCFQEFLDQLTRRHYPHAYVYPVTLGEKFETNRCQFEESVCQLALVLENHHEFFKPTEIEKNTKASPDENVIAQLREQVQPELMRVLGENPHLEKSKAQETVEACIARDASLPASMASREKLLERVLHDVLGLGPLESLMGDPEVTEIMANGPEDVFVEKKGKLSRSSARFASLAQMRSVIDRIVAPIGRRVDESVPLCDARLADGSRVNIVLPPLAIDGPMLTIRKFPARAMGFDELLALQSLSQEIFHYLKRAVLARRNIVVSGGTGSGKTTLLNALSALIPDEERIVTIEDAAELQLQKPHVVRLESRPSNAEGEGAIPIRRLVINALRMRPDRIVVGECRGGEALDMLQAMNTGHDGSMTTLHANSPRDTLGRLETLVLMSGMDLPVRVVREQIRSAVHVMVQQSRLPDGTRKITSVTELTGMEGDILTIQELFRFSAGAFESTGIVSSGLTR